jgi:hypothetical protein
LLVSFFEGRQYKLPVHLPEDGSTMLNVDKIVAQQQPDASGSTIPLDENRMKRSPGRCEKTQIGDFK